MKRLGIIPQKKIFHLLTSRLGHGVESTAILEPLNLSFVEGVLQGNLVGLAVLGVNNHGDGFAHSKLSSENIDLLHC